MAPSVDERLAILETQFRLFEARFGKVEKQVQEVHDVLLAARGARWFIVALATIIGFILGAWAKLHLFGK